LAVRPDESVAKSKYLNPPAKRERKIQLNHRHILKTLVIEKVLDSIPINID